jgi:hypothetical protein
MNGTTKFTWGLIIMLIGTGLTALGMAASATIIGAIIGIPMLLLGLPLMIWGTVWCFKGQMQKQQDAIARGVAAGIRESVHAGQARSVDEGPL